MNPMHQKAVDVHRMTIQRLHNAQRDIESQPAARNDIANRTRGWFEHISADRERAMRYAVANFADGSAPSPFIVKPLANGSIDLAPLLVALLGVDTLMASMGRFIDALPAGLTDADRALQLEEIRAARLEAENKEQDAIDAALAEGVHIPYRADADPAVVLRVSRP